jgi:hypothetical protein
MVASMNCKEFRDKLVDYLDGLVGKESMQFARHLETCDRCRKDYDELMVTMRMVKGVKLEDPGPEFWLTHRELIRDAAREQAESGTGEDVLSRILSWELIQGYRRLFFPYPHRLVVSLIILLCVITGIVMMKGDSADIIVPSREVRMVFDERALGEAYVSGALFRDVSTVDELSDLTDQELNVVFATMAEEVGFDIEKGNKDIIPLKNWEFDVENEIHGLDKGEMMKMLEILDEMSVRI